MKWTPLPEGRAQRIDVAGLSSSRGFGRLLIARFAAVNVIGVLLLLIAWRHGLVEQVWQADVSRLTVVMAMVFGWVLVVGSWRTWKISGELDAIDARGLSPKGNDYAMAIARGVDPSVAAAALRTKLLERIAFIRHASGVLVSLGLIGTVIGFIIALSGVDPSRVGDASSIGPMVAALIEGMGVALYTTLVGATLGIWTGLNHRILATGAGNLYATTLENVPCWTKTQAQSFATL